MPKEQLALTQRYVELIVSNIWNNLPHTVSLSQTTLSTT